MDWTKAKTILIIALLATNIFLIASHASRHSGSEQTTNDAALLQILASRNIEVATEIPTAHPNMRILHGEYTSVSNEEISAMIAAQDESVTYEDGDKACFEAAAGFLEQLGLFDDDVAEDRQANLPESAAADYVVTFRNEVEGVTVAGNYMNVYFREGKVSGLQYRWLDRTELSQRKVETIPAAVALMSVENADTETPMVITDIRMVYWIPTTSIEIGEAVSDTAFPAWRFSVEGQKDIYIEAI